MTTQVDNRRVDFQTRTAAASLTLGPNDGPFIASYRSATGTGTLVLPVLSTLPIGWRVTVVDVGGSAGTNTQTVQASVTDGSGVVGQILLNGGSLTLEVTTTTATGTTPQWTVFPSV